LYQSLREHDLMARSAKPGRREGHHPHGRLIRAKRRKSFDLWRRLSGA
jgi:hypothetical protein